jgi:ATP synthase F1 delta subunit
MIELIIAKRYAKATFETVNINEREAICQQIVSIKHLFSQQPQLVKYLSSPIVRKNDKTACIKDIFASMKNSDFWTNIFTAIIEKNRGELIQSFLYELESILNDALNHVKVDITLAHQLDEKTLQNIKNHLENILTKKIFLNISIDKQIIGGFVAKTESHLVDMSIKNNLTKFAQEAVHF